MDFKKEYEDALERAKGIYNDNPSSSTAKFVCGQIFPELKESEDERIRRDICTWLKHKQETCTYPTPKKETLSAWIDYLEKQNAEFIEYGRQEYFRGRTEAIDEQQPAEWSEEKKKDLQEASDYLRDYANNYVQGGNSKLYIQSLADRIESLRPQPKQESEPMKIKYAGKIYKVYGTKEFPGGVVGYKITDEPGYFDYIINPDEVLGGGYNIKSNGSFYPAKEANLDPPHWKPSEEQMDTLNEAICDYRMEDTASCEKTAEILESLYKDLEKL